MAAAGLFAGNFQFSSAAIGATIPAVPSSTQFDITGFLQSATLDNSADVKSGGVAVINGHTIVIPRETVVILPANALTWQELFTHAPAPYGPTQTGMALKDSPTPLTTYEVQIVGNRVIDPDGVNGCTSGITGFHAATAVKGAYCDRMIAGLVHVSQQDLNSGVGYINFIDYATGEMEVGGDPGVQGTGTRVRINDPSNATSVGQSGRYGRAFTPDDRFQVDQDNPTIESETGFPMCIPRVTSDPTVVGNADDPECPQANRPKVDSPVVDTSGVTPQPNTLIGGQHYTVFRMDTPAGIDAKDANGNPAPFCVTGRTPCADPRKQAPFEIGDYVSFAGNLVQDGGANGGQYIAAHTVTASLGIYTQPGVDPAYVTIEVALIGTGGLTAFGAGEAAVRTRFEGMATDETRLIRLYGVDIDPKDGTTSDREWGTIVPDPGPPNGAVRGRWRFRPPCTATVATDKQCTPPPAGQFIPPTREVRAVVDGLSQYLPGTLVPNPSSQVPGTASATTTANGLYWGQYHAPIGEYIFPENVPGTPVPENNFNTINFLAYGGYTSITGVKADVLNPWPSNVAPPPAPDCSVLPVINGAPYQVANGGSIQLSGTPPPTTPTPVTVNWTAGTGAFGSATENDLAGALTGANTTTPTFNATGLAAGIYNVNFTVAFGVCGALTASSTVQVLDAPAPTINPIQNQTVTGKTNVTITATSNSLPAPSLTWRQIPNGAPTVTFTPSSPGFTAPVTSASAINFIAPSVTVQTTLSFGVTAANGQGTSPETVVTVTVTATTPQNVTLTPVEYRINKQRLIITATLTDPTLVVTGMTVQPYLTESGTTFDPTSLGANLTISLVAPGSWTITAVGAPKPACNLGGTYATPCAQKPIVVKAFNGTSLVGTSAPTALDKIRT